MRPVFTREPEMLKKTTAMLKKVTAINKKNEQIKSVPKIAAETRLGKHWIYSLLREQLSNSPGPKDPGVEKVEKLNKYLTKLLQD